MNKQEIDKIYHYVMLEDFPDPLYCFAELVEAAAVAREREACAKLCESEGHRIDASWESCAIAIRQRGEK